MIDRAPQVMHLAVDLHIDLIEMPPPVADPAHRIHPLPSNIACKHRPEPVPPEPHSLMTKVDAALKQQVLDIPQ